MFLDRVDDNGAPMIPIDVSLVLLNFKCFSHTLKRLWEIKCVGDLKFKTGHEWSFFPETIKKKLLNMSMKMIGSGRFWRVGRSTSNKSIFNFGLDFYILLSRNNFNGNWLHSRVYANNMPCMCYIYIYIQWSFLLKSRRNLLHFNLYVAKFLTSLRK